MSKYQRNKLSDVTRQVENTKTFMNMAIHDLRAPSNHITFEVEVCKTTIKDQMKIIKKGINMDDG